MFYDTTRYHTHSRCSEPVCDSSNVSRTGCSITNPKAGKHRVSEARAFTAFSLSCFWSSLMPKPASKEGIKVSMRWTAFGQPARATSTPGRRRKVVSLMISCSTAAVAASTESLDLLLVLGKTPASGYQGIRTARTERCRSCTIKASTLKSWHLYL